MNTAVTTNRDEISKFNELAATWWDPAGPMWPLHKLNAIRVPFILDVLTDHGLATGRAAEPLSGLRVLDIGCGAGLLSESMASLGARVTGVDPAERNIAIARSHAAKTHLDIEYIAGSAEVLENRTFDVVLNMEVVEHVDNLALFMSSCNALTRPGGMQFLATINRNALSWLVAIVGAEYVLRWLPRGTHQWRKFIKPEEAASMLRQGDLEVLVSRGVSVNPVTRAYKVTRFTGVNYMLAARKKNPAA
jgi:2-polyprenyl-6-hydroxyphenyl methylase/3-demethylubiquinone-9 3-methyltransferase